MNDRGSRSGRVVGIAEGVAAAVRRRQREREPRVAVFDAAGASRLVAPSAPGYDRLLEVAGDMLALAGPGAREPRPRSSSGEQGPRSGSGEAARKRRPRSGSRAGERRGRRAAGEAR